MSEATRTSGEMDEFDYAAANLRQHWHDDGLGGKGQEWDGQPAIYKLAYLAGFAGALGVSFERFAEAARRTLGLEPGQPLSSEHDAFVKHAYHDSLAKYGGGQADGVVPRQVPSRAEPDWISRINAGVESLPSPSQIGRQSQEPGHDLERGHGQQRDQGRGR